MAGSGTAHLRPDTPAVLRVDELVVEFKTRVRHEKVHAVSGISLDVAEGETLGLVGESGCGKSSLARALVQLPPPTSGRVVFDDVDLTQLSKDRLREVRPALQMIYQDPIASLNPRRTVGDIVRQPLDVWDVGDKASRLEQVREMLRSVGLDPDATVDKHSGEFSGGQCQRICIARALILQPKVLVCDEPVSSLDVSVQAQILNLLEDMKSRYGLSMIFISHDLAVVKNITDRVAVMYLGKLCEVGPPEVLYEAPSHPYTAALVAAIPLPDPEVVKPPYERVGGDLPSPLSPPSGCRFRTRCPRATDRCAEEEPILRPVAGASDRFVACHFPLVDAN